MSQNSDEPSGSGSQIVRIPTGPLPVDLDLPPVDNAAMKQFQRSKQLNYVSTALPLPSPFTDDPITPALLFFGIKEKVLALPTFPAPFCHFPSPPYRITPVAQASTPTSAASAGLGMFATKAIAPGELIVYERPLMMLPIVIFAANKQLAETVYLGPFVQRMQPNSRDAYLTLANCKGPASMPYQGILDTNALPAGALPGWHAEHVVVGRDASRINHSCRPNAEYYWHLDSFTIQIRALRHIRKDQEITITYTNLGQPRAARQQQLREKYSFTCVCPVCTLPAQASKRSDIARALVSVKPDYAAADEELRAWVRNKNKPDDLVLRPALRQVQLMEDEGAITVGTWPLPYQRVVKAYCALGDKEKAKQYAARAAELSWACVGTDGGWEEVRDNIERTDWWRARC